MCCFLEDLRNQAELLSSAETYQLISSVALWVVCGEVYVLPTGETNTWRILRHILQNYTGPDCPGARADLGDELIVALIGGDAVAAP